MTRYSHKSTIILLTVLPLLFSIAAARPKAPTQPDHPIPIEVATMIVEINATDGDAGIQVFLDAEPWRSMMVFDPKGRRILDFKGEGRLKNFGLTELFSESNEPPFDVLPLEKFKKLFPKGRYTFVGTTIEGRKLVGKATLSHDFPNGPRIISPPDDGTVERDKVVARWLPVAEPPGIDIVGYRVIVTDEDPLRVFSVDLPATAHSVRVPPVFLEPHTEYQLEIQAIEESGNWTFSDRLFRTK